MFKSLIQGPTPISPGSASAEFGRWFTKSKDAEWMDREGQLYSNIWVLNQFDIFLYDALGLFETMDLPNHSSYLAFTCVHMCLHVHTHTHTHHSLPSQLQSPLDISEAEWLGNPTTDKSSGSAKALTKMILYL